MKPASTIYYTKAPYQTSSGTEIIFFVMTFLRWNIITLHIVKDKIRLTEIKKLTLQRKKKHILQYCRYTIQYLLRVSYNHTTIFSLQKTFTAWICDLSDKFAYTVLNNTRIKATVFCVYYLNITSCWNTTRMDTPNGDTYKASRISQEHRQNSFLECKLLFRSAK